MSRLQYWPSQPHYLLQAGSRTIRAGETFEASEEDAAVLLQGDDIRLAPEAEKPAARKTPQSPSSGTATKDQPDKEQ